MTDYHCHCLPGMDDGPRDSRTGAAMIRLLLEQGIGRIAATPHFSSRYESPARFLSRRESALKSLLDACPGAPLVPGAEVAITQGLSGLPGLDGLCITGSRLLLLELPYAPFRPWMANVVAEISNRLGIIPVLAHVERFLPWYDKDHARQVLSIPGAVFQVNNDSLDDYITRKFILNLLHSGLPVVFGSDCHNMDSRPPDADMMLRFLHSLLTHEQRDTVLQLNFNLLEAPS